MEPTLIPYKGYFIEITENIFDYKFDFIIKKDNKVIVRSPERYYFAGDAEVNAKMYINNLTNKF